MKAKTATAWSSIVLILIGIHTGALFAQSKKATKPAPVKEAAPATPAQKPQTGNEKLDISDLEQKYWSPKDTDFSVVQNRTYTKEKRFAATLITGPSLNDLYSEGLHYSISGSYFFSERSGVELHYVSSNLSDSSATNHFKTHLSGGGVAPDFNRLKSSYGVSYNWVPFYAKMSVLGTKIMYFDMAISPYLGYMTYEQQTIESLPNPSKSTMVFGLDISQFYFLHKNFAVRADLKGRWYKEDIISYQTGASVREKSSNYTVLMLGGTFFF